MVYTTVVKTFQGLKGMTTVVAKELLYVTRSRDVVFNCLSRGLVVEAQLKAGGTASVSLANQTYQIQGVLKQEV